MKWSNSSDKSVCNAVFFTDYLVGISNYYCYDYNIIVLIIISISVLLLCPSHLSLPIFLKHFDSLFLFVPYTLGMF